MLPIVISSLLLSKTRSLREIVPDKWREKWEEHLQLRVVVILSLIFQIILIALGGRRKKVCGGWIRAMVWFVYLSADAVAIYAAGVIRVEPPSLEINTNVLRTFWAPFLLMHLGGPDTITAYALEDNELWVRHSLTLVNQTAVTLYILLQTWNGSYISWLYVVILICGLIKYSERVWALRAASSEEFGESTPERHKRIPRMLEEQKLKEAEGHVVVTHQVIEVHKLLDRDMSVDWQDDEKKENLYKRSKEDILIARSLINIFQPAFTDQLLSDDDANAGRSTLKVKDKDMPYGSVFNIIAIELGFIYDLLFTKAMLFQFPWGVASRVVTLFLTTITLIVFTFTSLYENKASQYNKTDFHITFVLVVAAAFLELYGFLFQHLFSDKFISWLIKRNHESILGIINRLRPLSKRHRWSGKIGQFSLMSYSLKEKHYLYGHGIPKIQRYFYLTHRDVKDDLKVRLYDHIKTIPTDAPMYKDLQSLWKLRWKNPQREKLKSFEWSISEDLEFDMCVLIWHIATDICCHASHNIVPCSNPEKHEDINKVTREDAQVSLDLSRYMLHLLVMYPSLLPAGIGRIKFKDMHSMMTTFFDQYKSIEPQSQEAEAKTAENHPPGQNDPRKNCSRKEHNLSDCSGKEHNIFDWCEAIEAKNTTGSDLKTKQRLQDACNKLRKLVNTTGSDLKTKQRLQDACNKLRKQVNTQLNLTVSSTDKSKYVMFHGCHLASQLIEEIEEPRFRFWVLRETWIGLLVLAALKCKASYHVQHLRRGGELLTHVWLLLVHFGLTDHFKIPQNVEIAELIIK